MSAGFSSNENDVVLESLRTPAPKNERPGVATIRPECKIHVFASSKFWKTPTSGIFDSIARGPDGMGAPQIRKGTQAMTRRVKYFIYPVTFGNGFFVYVIAEVPRNPYAVSGK
jgi:hypothetical protein